MAWTKEDIQQGSPSLFESEIIVSARVKVVVRSCRVGDKVYIDVRKWSLWFSINEWKPTSKGIMLELSAFEKVLPIIQEVITQTLGLDKAA